MTFSDCAAKTTPDNQAGLSVYEHCRIVGHVARSLVETLPASLRKRVPPYAITLAALHDVGKVSPGFQLKYFREAVRAYSPALADCALSDFETDHAAIGAAALNRYLGVEFGLSAPARIIGVHHGSIRKYEITDDLGVYGGKLWADERRLLIERIVNEFGGNIEPDISREMARWIAGLVSVADWIGSDETYFPSEGLPADMDLDPMTRDAVRACGFGLPKIRAGLSFRDIFGFDPWPMQEQFAEVVDGSGLYILEAPMGMGKTEAAFMAAYRLLAKGRASGIYFGLPTRLTSDKIHERTNQFLARIVDGDVSALLAHGTAWLNAYEHGEAGDRDDNRGDAAVWFHPAKRKLLYPFAVGTVDQALFSVLRVRHSFVRTFGLAGKVVILDEVHSYDMYTGTLLDELVRRLLELDCTVIILSATLSPGKRHQLTTRSGVEVATETDSRAYPLITRVYESGAKCVGIPPPRSKRHRVVFRSPHDPELADEIMRRAGSGENVLWIANTVADAQSRYDAVKAAMPERAFPVGLLHSRFPVFRRNEIEKEWLDKLGKDGARPAGSVLVATQVVEQSVDIDADLLVTDLAPTDMLLQRMGRQWRHPFRRRTDAPETWILSGEPEESDSADDLLDALGRASCRVYSPYWLWRTYRIWHTRRSVSLPEDIRELIENTYAEMDPDEESAGIRTLREKCGQMVQRLCAAAGASFDDITSMPTLEDREGVATRYSDVPTIQVLLAGAPPEYTGPDMRISLLEGGRELTVFSEFRDFSAMRKLYRNIVTIPAYYLTEKLSERTPACLRNYFFETTVLLYLDPVRDPAGRLYADGEFCGLTYTPERGIRREKPKKTHGPDEEPREAGEPLNGNVSGPEIDGLGDIFDKSRFDW